MISPEDYVKKPVRSLQTMLQTLCAVFPPLPNVIPDGIYGDATCAAVAAFQTFSGLTATGIADHETWNALVACYLHHAPRVLPPEPLRIVLQPGQTIAPGERNLHVYLVQAMLQALGQCYANSDPPAVTGILDASTQRAVRSLQALFGHEQTGVIDHRFWAYLMRLYTLSAGDGTHGAPSASSAVNYLL